MKKLFSIGIIFTLMSCTNSEPVNINDLVVVEDSVEDIVVYKKTFNTDSGKGFTGTVFELNEDGSMKTQFNVRRGNIIDEKIERFYPDGTLEAVKTVGADGSFTGLQEFYYANGNIESRYFISNFFPLIKLSEIEKFMEDGSRSSIYENWFPRENQETGKVYFVRNGKEQYFFKDGKLETEKFYSLYGFSIYEIKYDNSGNKVYEFDYRKNFDENVVGYKYFPDGTKDEYKVYSNLNASKSSNIDNLKNGGSLFVTKYDSENNKVLLETFAVPNYEISTMLNESLMQQYGYTLSYTDNNLSGGNCIRDGKDVEDWKNTCADKNRVYLRCGYTQKTWNAVGNLVGLIGITPKMYQPWVLLRLKTRDDGSIYASSYSYATFAEMNDPSTVYQEEIRFPLDMFNERELGSSIPGRYVEMEWDNDVGNFFLDRQEPRTSFHESLASPSGKIYSSCDRVPYPKYLEEVYKIRMTAKELKNKREF